MPPSSSSKSTSSSLALRYLSSDGNPHTDVYKGKPKMDEIRAWIDKFLSTYKTPSTAELKDVHIVKDKAALKSITELNQGIHVLLASVSNKDAIVDVGRKLKERYSNEKLRFHVASGKQAETIRDWFSAGGDDVLVVFKPKDKKYTTLRLANRSVWEKQADDLIDKLMSGSATYKKLDKSLKL